MFLVPAWLLNWFFFKTKVSRILPGKAECEYCWRQDETNRIWSLKYIECWNGCAWNCAYAWICGVGKEMCSGVITVWIWILPGRVIQPQAKNGNFNNPFPPSSKPICKLMWVKSPSKLWMCYWSYPHMPLKITGPLSGWNFPSVKQGGRPVWLCGWHLGVPSCGLSFHGGISSSRSSPCGPSPAGWSRLLTSKLRSLLGWSRSCQDFLMTGLEVLWSHFQVLLVKVIPGPAQIQGEGAQVSTLDGRISMPNHAEWKCWLLCPCSMAAMIHHPILSGLKWHTFL